MIEDEILFTPYFATVIVEIQKNVATIVNKHLQIAYIELCILASLETHNGRMQLCDFPGSLTASSNTAIVAASRLQKKGLLTKTKRANDKRITILHRTDAGVETVKQGFDLSYRYLSSTVWRKHSEKDIEEIMTSFSRHLDALGIDPQEANNRCHPIITPAYFIAIGSLLYRWTHEIKAHAKLSLTEFRCLLLLESTTGTASSSDIAEALFLDRSSISLITASLARKGLVSVCREGRDKRVHSVSITEKGEVCTALLTARLSRVTAQLYAGIAPELKTKTNELLMRMYACLRKTDD